MCTAVLFRFPTDVRCSQCTGTLAPPLPHHGTKQKPNYTSACTYFTTDFYISRYSRMIPFITRYMCRAPRTDMYRVTALSFECPVVLCNIQNTKRQPLDAYIPGGTRQELVVSHLMSASMYHYVLYLCAPALACRVGYTHIYRQHTCSFGSGPDHPSICLPH